MRLFGFKYIDIISLPERFRTAPVYIRRNEMEKQETGTGAAVCKALRKPLFFKAGRWYFTREGERRFFFILTLGMAVWGICIRLGVW